LNVALAIYQHELYSRLLHSEQQILDMPPDVSSS